MTPVFFLTGALLAALSGCEAEAPEAGASGPVERQAVVVATPQVARAEVPGAREDRWLTFKDTRDPIAWLASFDDAPEAGEEARRNALRDVIAELDARYLEDPRMLANRTVQLRNMLGESGLDEDMLQLLQGFASLTRGEEGREGTNLLLRRLRAGEGLGDEVVGFRRQREHGAGGGAVRGFGVSPVAGSGCLAHPDDHVDAGHFHARRARVSDHRLDR